MKLRISEVRAVAMNHPGMWDDLWRAGKLAGDCIEIEREAFEGINQRYLGLTIGTTIHHILRPVVDVIDALAGTSLGDCGGCAERELKINALGR